MTDRTRGEIAHAISQLQELAFWLDKAKAASMAISDEDLRATTPDAIGGIARNVSSQIIYLTGELKGAKT